RLPGIGTRPPGNTPRPAARKGGPGLFPGPPLPDLVGPRRIHRILKRHLLRLAVYRLAGMGVGVARPLSDCTEELIHQAMARPRIVVPSRIAPSATNTPKKELGCGGSGAGL